MKQMLNQLKSISKSLANLSTRVEKVTQEVEKLQSAPKAPAAKKAAAKRTPAGGKTVLDSVFEIIKRSRKGVSIAELRSKTNLDARQLSNALYKLSKKGMVQTKARGVYEKK